MTEKVWIKTGAHAPTRFWVVPGVIFLLEVSKQVETILRVFLTIFLRRNETCFRVRGLQNEVYMGE